MKRQNLLLMAIALFVMFSACQKEEMVTEEDQSAPIGVPSVVLPPDIGFPGEENIQKDLKATASFPAADLNGMANWIPDPVWPTVYFDIINEWCSFAVYFRLYVRHATLDPFGEFYILRDWYILNEGMHACYSYMDGWTKITYNLPVWTQGVMYTWNWNGSEWEGPLQSDFEVVYTYPGM